MTTSESTCGHNTLMSSGWKRAKEGQYKFYTVSGGCTGAIKLLRKTEIKPSHA